MNNMIKVWTRKTKMIMKSGRIVTRFYFKKITGSIVVEKDKEGLFTMYEDFDNPIYYSRLGFGETLRECFNDFRNDLKKERRLIV